MGLEAMKIKSNNSIFWTVKKLQKYNCFFFLDIQIHLIKMMYLSTSSGFIYLYIFRHSQSCLIALKSLSFNFRVSPYLYKKIRIMVSLLPESGISVRFVRILVHSGHILDNTVADASTGELCCFKQRYADSSVYTDLTYFLCFTKFSHDKAIILI